MKFLYYILAFCFLYVQSIDAQKTSNHEIKFNVNNYQNDTLILGYYYGNRQLVKDTILRSDKGQFVVKAEEALNSGMYLVLVKPSNAFLQFLVPEDDQKFELSFDFNDVNNVKFKGSELNDKFYEYLDYLAQQREKFEELSEKMILADSIGTIEEKTALEKKKEKLNNQVDDEQRKIVSDNKGNLLALLIESSFTVDTPTFEGTEDEIKEQNYLFHRKHFFDHVDPTIPSNLYMPYLHPKVEQFIDKMTPQHPDTINAAIDKFLTTVKEVPETYKFYLSYFLNKYANSRVVGMDAVFVHLVDEYYAKGKAPWIEMDNLKKLVSSANRIKPTLIGKTGADLTLYQQDGTPVTLSQIECDYMVLMFWAPSCGHCTKSMPAAVEFNEKFKDKGVKFISICTKHQDKYPACWEAIEPKHMENFLNLGDENHTSRFKTKYNVDKTPKIFIMDSDLKILIKDIGTQQLETIMENIIEDAKKEKQMK